MAVRHANHYTKQAVRHIYIYIYYTEREREREISIALDSKRELWVVRQRRLTHGDTGFAMCADSTIREYIPRIRGVSQIVVALRMFSLGFPCVLNDVCITVNCIMANQYFLLNNVYLFMINI